MGEENSERMALVWASAPIGRRLVVGALIGRPTDPDDIATLKAAGLICLKDYFPGGIHEEFPDPAWGYGITPIGRKYVAGLAD